MTFTSNGQTFTATAGDGNNGGFFTFTSDGQTFTGFDPATLGIATSTSFQFVQPTTGPTTFYVRRAGLPTSFADTPQTTTGAASALQPALLALAGVAIGMLVVV